MVAWNQADIPGGSENNYECYFEGKNEFPDVFNEGYKKKNSKETPKYLN